MFENPSTSEPAEHSDTEIELFRPCRTKCVFCKPKTARPGSVSYHRFPRLPEMSDIWARKSGFKHVLKASPSNRHKSFRVCSLHFKESDYVNRITGRLHRFAVPSRIENNIAVTQRTENDIAVPPRIEHNINIDISEIKKTLKESLMNMTPTTETQSNNISEDSISGNADSSKTISVPLNPEKQPSVANPHLFVDLTLEAESNNMNEVVNGNAESLKTTSMSLNRRKQSSAVNPDLVVDLTVEAERNNISENNVSGKAESPQTRSTPFNTKKQASAVSPDVFVDLTFEIESNNMNEDVVSESTVSSNALSMPASKSQLNASNHSLTVTHELLNLTFAAGNNIGEAETNTIIKAESNNISENAVSRNAESPKTVSTPLRTKRQSSAVIPDLFVDLTFEAGSNNISDDAVKESAVSPNTLPMPASTSKLNTSNQQLAVTHELLNLTFDAENNNISEAESNTIIKAKSNNINEVAVRGNNESPKTISAPLTASKPNRRKQSFAVTRDSLDPVIVKEKKIPQLKIVLFKKKTQKKKMKSRKN